MALFGKLFKKKEPSRPEVVPVEEVELQDAPFNLNDTLRDVANILSLDAQEKRISIVYRMKKNVPSAVIGDRYKLSRLLSDIIGNAIDFTDKREDVVVQISRNESNDEALELHFEVIDYGVGMDETVVEEILMPMLTSDTPAAAFEIRGSGLQRARDIVHAMQGSIRLSSRPKKGTRVNFHLLLSAENLKEKRHYRLPNKEGVGRKTLVVDNDIGSAKAVVPMLEYFRHDVSVGNVADLAFMESYDIVMVSSEYWSDELYADIQKLGEACPKIVMIESMINHQEVEERALEYVDWLIYKPFTQQFVFEMLVALYSDALSTAPEESEAAAPEAPAVEEAIKEEALPEPHIPEEVAPAADTAKAKAVSAVEAFLNGTVMAGEQNERSVYCKSAHQFFVAADGLAHCGNDYTAFVEKLKEAIWKYVKADRVIMGMIGQGQLGEAAEYCVKMKQPLAELGVYKLACLADLLETACRERNAEEIEALTNAIGFILKQTISSLDQFIEQSKYKIR
ncbi:ATP-binding protein [Sulfurimonas sp. HSL-3221]|uniref:sensor histidine kinase n=1 Tax=Sulfurimonadaceae TaxID=2771471 RepID=UPI001E42FB48|nr:ATP-binding protein [Sulfurimonas sp. HSL-3221]UFS63506.1 ATP-binding protein [Sulfurimonas sp. HSL-3221]